MSVYISGMEIPTGCVNCPLNYDATCNLIPFGFPDETNGSERRPNCPLLPVPDHGRLVDADAFIEKQRELYCLDCNRRKGMKRGKLKIIYDVGEAPCRSCRLDDALYDLDEMPTIIPADNEEGVGE